MEVANWPSQTVKIPQADHQKLSPRLEAGFRIARSGEDNPLPPAILERADGEARAVLRAKHMEKR